MNGLPEKMPGKWWLMFRMLRGDIHLTFLHVLVWEFRSFNAGYNQRQDLLFSCGSESSQSAILIKSAKLIPFSH